MVADEVDHNISGRASKKAKLVTAAGNLEELSRLLAQVANEDEGESRLYAIAGSDIMNRLTYTF